MITIKIHGVIQNREYELQASSIEEIKQQVVLLWQTINTSFEGRNFCVSVFRH